MIINSLNLERAKEISNSPARKVVRSFDLSNHVNVHVSPNKRQNKRSFAQTTVGTTVRMNMRLFPDWAGLVLVNIENSKSSQHRLGSVVENLL